jgi:2-polyprenyl-3-methyl-5-hydroxy-6-metoxy-1,4-benzoquinol methylase
MAMDKATGELLLQALERVEAALQTIKAIVNDALKNASSTSTTSLPTPSSHRVAGVTNRKSKIQVAESLPAAQLGPIPNVHSEAWPESIPAHMNVANRGDLEKQFRAVQIVSLMQLNLNGKKVLDLGCGEGHVAKEIGNQAKKAVGMDIHSHNSWDRLTSRLVSYTDDRKQAQEWGPYDAIILYDVLDHLEGQDPVGFMTWVASLLADDESQIFIRTHPWTSKHGSHLYETGLNKAYAHLALTPDELAQMGVDVKPNLRIIRPMAAYEHTFKEAKLKTTDRKGHNEPVDPFFTGDILDRIVKVTWRGQIDLEAALKVMSNQFIDYVLVRA